MNVSYSDWTVDKTSVLNKKADASSKSLGAAKLSFPSMQMKWIVTSTVSGVKRR